MSVTKVVPFSKITKTAKQKAKEKKLYGAKPAKRIAQLAVRNVKRLEALREDARVLRLAKKGHTFEEVAKIITEDNESRGEAGISPKQALELTKSAIDRWCGDLALDAKQAKELDVKRIDALMVILWDQIEPKPLQDQHGFPILDAATGAPAMSAPDYVAVKLYNDLLARRAKMLGLDSDEAAVKVNIENNVIERRYVGANPDDL